MKHRTSLYVLLFACSTTACVGNIFGGGGDGRTDEQRPGATPETTPEPAEKPVCAEGICVGASGLTRMTRTQYFNTVKALLGVEARVDTKSLPPDHAAAGLFASNESQNVNVDDVARYATAAEAAAASALLVPLVPCDIATGTRICFEKFVASFGARAYRRPLTTEDSMAYLDAFDWARTKGDSFDATVRLAIGAMLQSPSFLYLIEQSATTGPRKLSGLEVATRLSFFMFREAPSEALLTRAREGLLDTPEGVAKEASAMLADPRFDRAIREFHREWLGINDVPMATPSGDFTQTVARDMLEETDRFAVYLFREADGKQATLFGAPYSLVNANLAAYYNVPAPATPFAVTSIPDRAGILTQGSVLTAQSTAGYTAPIFRGIFVRTRVLCDSLGARPDNVDESIAKKETTIPASISDRERLTLLTGQAPCNSCHEKTNDIGFAFHAFDGAGKRRVKDTAGFGIDTSAKLSGGFDPDFATDVDGAYAGAVPLATALGKSETVASCMTLQWMRYALGREATVDTTAHAAALESYRASGLDLRRLIVGIVASDAFRHRAAPPPESP